MVGGAVDWGTVPEWIAAIGTALAFMAAAVVLAVQLVDRTREAARGVSAWFGGSAEGDSGLEAGVRVRNTSAYPVYDVVGALVLTTEPTTKPCSTPPNGGWTGTRVSAPNDTAVLPVYEFGGSAGIGRRIEAEVAFTDHNARHRQRDVRRKLRRIKFDPDRFYAIDHPTPW